MNHFYLKSVTFVSLFFCAGGCRTREAIKQKPDDRPTVSPQQDTAARVNVLKKNIREIALKYRSQSDVLSAITTARAEMLPLISELVTLVPAKKPIDMVPQLLGVWTALWRDEDVTLRRDVSGTLNSGVRVIPEQAYQGFITGDRAYVNFANSEISRNDPVTGAVSKTVSAGFLFATFTPTENYNKALFRVVYGRKKPLQENEDLSKLTNAIWSSHKLTLSDVETDRAKGLEQLKAMEVVRNTRVGEFPNGPINSPGEQRNIYLDDDFRISLGSNGNDEPQFDVLKDEKKYGLNVTERVANPSPQ